MLARKKDNCAMKDRKFKVFGTPWTLKYLSKPIMEVDGDTVYGETDFIKRIIKVSTRNSDKTPRLKCEIEVTLLHELMHCIFGEGQYRSCNIDEPLVEWCAKCLKSFKDQNII